MYQSTECIYTAREFRLASLYGLSVLLTGGDFSQGGKGEDGWEILTSSVAYSAGDGGSASRRTYVVLAGTDPRRMV